MRFSKQYMIDKCLGLLESTQQKFAFDVNRGRDEISGSMKNGDFERVMAFGRCEMLLNIVEHLESNKFANNNKSSLHF